MAATTVESCTCKSEFQDARYGTGKRLHNTCENKSKGRCVCTVCGASKR